MSGQELTPDAEGGQRYSEDFTYEGMSLPQEALRDLRLALYHSKGSGYYVVRQFIDSGHVQHIRRLWSTIDPNDSHERFPGKRYIYRNCPNYYAHDPHGNKTFYNFPWNAPLDQLTLALAVQVHVLRNFVTGRMPYTDLLGGDNGILSYRVVITRNSQTWIAPHQDFVNYERRFEKGRHDLTRLQATLFLSEKGLDYEGIGFKLECNDGHPVIFGSDVNMFPGDLVLWRHNNLHSVEDVHSNEGDIGFARMIFPVETIMTSPVRFLSMKRRLRMRLRLAYRKLTDR